MKLFGNLGNIGEMLQQASKLQANMEKIKGDLERLNLEGDAGGGMVTVRINGAFEVLDVRVDPALFASGDAQMLQDLLRAAIADALRKGKEALKSQVSQVMGGIPLPGL